MQPADDRVYIAPWKFRRRIGQDIDDAGMAAAGQLLLDPLAKELAARVVLAPPPRLTVAALGNDAGLLGAAAAALRSVGYDRLVRSWQSQPPSVAEAAAFTA